MTDQTKPSGLNTDEPVVTRNGLFTMQVCVPKTFTDEETVEYANRVNPAGTSHGWFLCQQGNPVLNGDDSIVQCLERPNCVHRVLEV